MKTMNDYSVNNNNFTANPLKLFSQPSGNATLSTPAPVRNVMHLYYGETAETFWGAFLVYGAGTEVYLVQ